MNAQPGIVGPATPSYWRHAAIGAALFALVGFLRSSDLLGTFLVELGFIALSLIPHARGQEAHGFHKGMRRALGWLGTALSGLTLTLVVLGTPFLFFIGRFDWNQLIDGVIAFGYLGFTAYLFRTRVDAPVMAAVEEPQDPAGASTVTTAQRIFRAEINDGFRDRVVIGGLAGFVENIVQRSSDTAGEHGLHGLALELDALLADYAKLNPVERAERMARAIEVLSSFESAATQKTGEHPTTVDLMASLKASLEAARAAQKQPSDENQARQKLLSDIAQSSAAAPKSSQPRAAVVDGALIAPGLADFWLERATAEAVWNSLRQTEPNDPLPEAEEKSLRIFVYSQANDSIADAAVAVHPSKIRDMLKDGLVEFNRGQIYNRYVLTQTGLAQLDAAKSGEGTDSGGTGQSNDAAQERKTDRSTPGAAKAWTTPDVDVRALKSYEIRRPGMLGAKHTRGYIRTSALTKAFQRKYMTELFLMTEDKVTIYDDPGTLKKDFDDLFAGFLRMGWSCPEITESALNNHLFLTTRYGPL